MPKDSVLDKKIDRKSVFHNSLEPITLDLNKCQLWLHMGSIKRLSPPVK